MTIRLAAPSDAEAIAAVNVASWQAAYRDQLPADQLAGIQVGPRVARWRTYLEAVEPPARAVYVADLADHAGLSGQIVGYAYVLPSRDADADASVGELVAIYVHPAHWSAGVGRELMSAALSSLRSAGFTTATLWVLAGNDRASRFYERAGWRADGTEQSADIMGVQLSEIRYTTKL